MFVILFTAQAMWQSFKRTPTQETRAAVVNYINHQLERYADLPLDRGGLYPTKRVEKQWWLYLPWLNSLQWFSQGHDTKSFSILPLCSFASKHITIDTGILHGLLKRVAERTGVAQPEALAAFRVNRRVHWEAYFHLSKAESNSKRRDFEYMLQTDGLAVSVILSKVKVVVAADTPVAVPDLEGKRVIGLDPGRVDLTNCAWTAEDDTAQFSRYSNKVCTYQMLM